MREQIKQGFLMVMLSLFASSFWVMAAESELVINSVEAKALPKNRIQLSADSTITMSREQIDMLYNGIPLTFNYELKVSEFLVLGLTNVVAEHKFRYALKYHALSKQFVVRDLINNTQSSHPTLSLALAQISEIQNFKFTLERDEERQYQGLLKLWLDIEALPAPLRIPAYLSSRWGLNSGWYRWSVP